MENTTDQKEFGKVARVYVNEIEVGSIPTDLYHALVKVKKRDVTLYLKQALNILYSASNAVSRIAFLTTIAFVAIFVVMFMFDGQSAVEMVKQFREANPEQIVSSMQRFILSMVVITTFATVFHFSVNPSRYGYVNHIHKAINQSIRKVMEVPAEGNMRVMVETKVTRHVKQ